jgi:hypothetical protein
MGRTRTCSGSDRTYRVLGVAVVPVQGEEEAAAGVERGHVPGALRREAHGRGVQPLQLGADRLVEVDEDEHRRLRRRPSPRVGRGRAARNRRRRPDRSRRVPGHPPPRRLLLKWARLRCFPRFLFPVFFFCSGCGFVAFPCNAGRVGWWRMRASSVVGLGSLPLCALPV